MSLHSYAFDGLANKRSYDASGSSKEAFVKRIQAERKERETNRKQNSAAIIIQAVVRSYITRRRVSKLLRTNFESNSGSKNQAKTQLRPHTPIEIQLLAQQIKRINVFFEASVDTDGEKLVWICQNLLQSRNSNTSDPNAKVSELINAVGIYSLAKFLRHSISYLLHIANDPKIPFGPPLRTIEIYGFMSPILTMNLVRAGYFKCIRKLLEERVPGSHLDISSHPPTALAESLFSSFVKPFQSKSGLQLLNNGPHDRDVQLNVMQCFIRDIFSPVGTSQIICFLLPAISDLVTKGTFPYETLLDALLHPDWQSSWDETTGITKFNLNPEIRPLVSPMLSLSLLTLTEAFLSISSSETDSLLKKLLTALGSVITSLVSDKSPCRVSSDMEMDWEGISFNPSKIQSYTKMRSLKILNGSLVTDFLLCAGGEGNQKGARYLAMICHVITQLQNDSGSTLESNLLYRLSFNGNFLRMLWEMILDTTTGSSSSSLFGSSKPLIDKLQRGISLTNQERDALVPLLSLFCFLFTNMLLTVHDTEFYKDKSLKPPELTYMSLMIRNTALGLIELAFPESRHDLGENYRGIEMLSHGDEAERKREALLYTSLFETIVQLLQHLHERDARISFTRGGSDFWSCHGRITLSNQKMFRSDRRGMAQLFSSSRFLSVAELEEQEGVALSPSELRNLTILRQTPFVVPFNSRVEILQALIRNDQLENRAGAGLGMWDPNAISVRVRRTHLYEDAFHHLSLENEPNLKKPIRVHMTNWAGAEEAGVDGGGVFREFLGELLKEGFKPERGIFTSTPHEGLLYPNPLAVTLLPDSYQQHYHFLGRIVGKLLFEHQLTELRFAPFFLMKLLGKNSGNVDIHHLSSLDPLLYKNLLYLKTYKGDVSDLNLDFSLVVDELGIITIVDLKPNGRNIVVTNENRIEFIHLCADFYLNKQIRLQTKAFLVGLSEMIDLDWLGMFDHREMQILISGADVDIDVEDMKAHTVYSGGYSFDHVVIECFWSIMTSLTPSQKRKLLKFITACSRPPLLGFKELAPPICIQLVPDVNRLPTAATCMNFLKLPAISDAKELKKKILYAIESETGFELS